MVVFLFDGSTASPQTKRAFLAALLRTTNRAGLRSRLFEGALLIYTMAQYVIEADRSGDRNRYTMDTDRDTCRAIAGDLVETLSTRPHSVSPDELLVELLTNRLECLGLAVDDIDFANALDAELRGLGEYLGYVQPDLGNPIHYELFVRLLSKREQLDCTTIIEAWPELFPVTWSMMATCARLCLNGISMH